MDKQPTDQAIAPLATGKQPADQSAAPLSVAVKAQARDVSFFQKNLTPEVKNNSGQVITAGSNSVLNSPGAQVNSGVNCRIS